MEGGQVGEPVFPGQIECLAARVDEATRIRGEYLFSWIIGALVTWVIRTSVSRSDRVMYSLCHSRPAGGCIGSSLRSNEERSVREYRLGNAGLKVAWGPSLSHEVSGNL